MNRLLTVLLLVSVLSATEAFGQIKDRVAKPRPKPPTTTTTTKPKPPKTPKMKDFTTEGFRFFIVGPSEVAVTPDKNNKPSGHLAIPASVTYQGKEYRVVKVGYGIEKHTKSVYSFQFWTFEYNKEITSVTIPDGVKTIGKRAFMDCENLTSISIPNSVTTL